MNFDLKPKEERKPEQPLYPLSLDIRPDAIRAQYICHDQGSHNECYDFEYRQYSPWTSIRLICFFDGILLIESIPDIRKIEFGKEAFVDLHWPWYKSPQWMWHKLQIPIPPEQRDAVLSELRKYHAVITDPNGYVPAERPKVVQHEVSPPIPGMEIFM